MASFYLDSDHLLSALWQVDKRLDAIGTPQALALKGQAGIAQAKLAYELFQRKFSGPRWEALAARGARPQRPLWASTGQ